MRHLVYETKEQALREERLIFSRGAQIAALNGYDVDAEGILAMTPAGETTTARTTAWDIPRQRLDGKWVILHPAHNDAARNPDWLAFVMAGITTPVEAEATDWWPVSEEV